ncbi:MULTISPECIES: LuxR C-terminal-related transcriptional regulator [Bacteroidota]|uniref:LuxR C-terminal-related transcriptional regulator n=1 Tax=Bacteroidota TaxID=976 RepID=UPI001F3F1551|nr:LuxR C-terminal-related transcriptional regulator [Chryseobacterium sp. R2A-55]
MRSLKFDVVKQTWSEISKYDREISLPPDFELDLYKKLFDRFHPGPYYYYIFNVFEAKMEFVSPEVTSVIGYKPEDFSPDLVVHNIHPEDQDRFVQYEQKVTDFFTQLPSNKIPYYKVHYDYRLRCANNCYKWILQQVSTIQSSDDGGVIRVLGVHTDISFLKTEATPSGLSFIGLDGEPSFYDVLLPYDRQEVNSPLSIREKEIVNLMLSGQKSEEIANVLKLSIHTIKTHRKNIFRKTECKTLTELGAKIIKQGWI